MSISFPLAIILAALPVALVFGDPESPAADPGGGLSAVVTDRRIEIIDRGRQVLGWQKKPLAEPEGGAKFAGSAFLHPLCTPSGFVLTEIQPADHRHHFGVWWPWKQVGVGGAKFNTWELQQGQGRHLAVSAGVADPAPPGGAGIDVENRCEIFTEGAWRPAILEQGTIRIGRLGADAYLLDIGIRQRPAADLEVTIPAYRYSGFSWRGPAGWNKDNSRMRTSEGRGRDDTNHQAARWVSVDGETPGGRATMLLMSAAAMDGGEPELLRVWDSKTHGGAPFVNFNPVVRKSQPLDRRAVAMRRYRLVLADREIKPEEAARLWQAWSREAP